MVSVIASLAVFLRLGAFEFVLQQVYLVGQDSFHRGVRRLELLLGVFDFLFELLTARG